MPTSKAPGTSSPAGTSRVPTAVLPSSPTSPSDPRSTIVEACRALAAALGHPGVSQGTLDYFQQLADAADLHVRKVAGYGKADDAWANFRDAQRMGLTPVQGVVLRMNDKMARINNLVQNGDLDLIGETIDREFADMAGYSLIGKCLVEEQR